MQELANSVNQLDPLKSIQDQFLSFQSKLQAEQDKNFALAEEVKALKREKASITPELLAKMHQEGKDLKAKEAKLLEVRKGFQARFDKEKAEYEKSLAELARIDEQLAEVNDSDRNGAAILYAKMDAFIEQSRLKCEAELERAKVERTKAENERQRADDLLSSAEAKIKQVQDKGKSVFEKIALAEKTHEAKLDELTKAADSQAKRKETLEKQIEQLNKALEKKKALLGDVK